MRIFRASLRAKQLSEQARVRAREACSRSAKRGTDGIIVSSREEESWPGRTRCQVVVPSWRDCALARTARCGGRSPTHRVTVAHWLLSRIQTQ